MVGFVQKKNSSTIENHKVQCFYAIKTDSEAIDAKDAVEKTKKKA